MKEYSTKGRITKVKKSPKGKITAYLVDVYGWIMKKEAIELTNLKKIDAVVVKRGRSVFLRSRANKIQSDNLSNKV